MCVWTIKPRTVTLDNWSFLSRDTQLHASVGKAMISTGKLKCSYYEYQSQSTSTDPIVLETKRVSMTVSFTIEDLQALTVWGLLACINQQCCTTLPAA